MFLFVLVIDHSSRTPSLIEDFKAERETVWHCVNFVDGRITFTAISSDSRPPKFEMLDINNCF